MVGCHAEACEAAWLGDDPSGRLAVLSRDPAELELLRDAFALVDANGTLVEFLSYGGTFAGVGGAANGVTSTDIGVTETSATQAGQSLQRDNAGVWQPAATASFGACYGQTPPPPANSITFTGRTSADPALPDAAASSGPRIDRYDPMKHASPDAGGRLGPRGPAVPRIPQGVVAVGFSTAATGP